MAGTSAWYTFYNPEFHNAIAVITDFDYTVSERDLV